MTKLTYEPSTGLIRTPKGTPIAGMNNSIDREDKDKLGRLLAASPLLAEVLGNIFKAWSRGDNFDPDNEKLRDIDQVVSEALGVETLL